jgi:hypothetical protein
LGGDGGVVGKSLLLNGQKLTVIGAAGPDVDFPAGAEIWSPLDLSSPVSEDRANHSLLVLGRLKKDASIVHAGADLQALANLSFGKTLADCGINNIATAVSSAFCCNLSDKKETEAPSEVITA